MIEVDIPAHGSTFKKSLPKLRATAFEQFAVDRSTTSLAVHPSGIRVFADSRTQEILEAYRAGAASAARMFTESNLDTEALREKIRDLADSR